MDDPRDKFPIGMRVLAVDDDPACLKLLERLLRRCQYDVTVTKNAIMALKLLRENKDKFDLVISDVVMPGMDGLKLLELVGLEMDLPVIMLSGNDDPKMVMKGITHGACDYLLKPIRIEELKNIWQHVIRKKKKIDLKELNKTNNQDMPDSGLCNAVESATTGDSDQNEKLTRKRKDQDENDDDDDEYESNGDDNEDSSNRKKARVVWSVELHRKFVCAVNQVGIDKAVPKKILDLMNVEKLTRENVASHLQKYRLYLKRISCVENQQANMVEALGSADQSYLRMGSLSGVGGFPTLNVSGQFPHNNAAFRSFPTGGMIGRLNTPSSLFGTHQLGHAQNLNNSENDQLKFQSAIRCGYQNRVQGIPTSVSLVQNLTNVNDTKTSFPMLNNKLTDQMPQITMGCTPSPVLGISNNALMLEVNPQDTQENSEFPFSLLNNGNCSDIWSSAVHSSRTSSYRPSTIFRQAPTDNMTSSITSLSNQCPDSLTDMHSQNNDFSFQWWDDANVIGSSINSLIPVNGVVDPQCHKSTNSTFNRNLDFNFSNPIQMKRDGIIELTGENSLKPHQMYTMNHIAGRLGHCNDE